MIAFPRLSSMAQLKKHKRGLIIGGGIAMVITGIISYALWSRQVWMEYEPAYVQWRQSIKADVDKVTAMPIKSAKDREAALTAYVAAVKRIDATSQAQCTVPAAVGWQMQFMDSLKTLEAICRAEIGEVTQFKKFLETATVYLNDDVAIAKIITAIPQPAELADNDWSQQVVVWSEVIKATEDLEVSKSFQATKTLLVANMTDIRSAWQEVIAASDAKDKTKYLAAQNTLAAAHDGLNELIMEDNANTLDELLKPLPTAYNKAFPRSI